MVKTCYEPLYKAFNMGLHLSKSRTYRKHLPGIDKKYHHPSVLEHGLRLERNSHVLPSVFPNVELPLFEEQKKDKF